MNEPELENIGKGPSKKGPIAGGKAAKQNPPANQPVRSINEDDDGYDPYTDFHDRPVREPLFERDPWD